MFAHLYTFDMGHNAFVDRNWDADNRPVSLCLFLGQ